MNKVIQRFKNTYHWLNSKNLSLLEELYEEKIHFQDPFLEIQGLQNFRAYLQNLYSELLECRFQFKEEILQEGEAVLFWSLCYRHRHLRSSKKIQLAGVSHIKFAKKIYYHRDYFDGGALVYEHLPVVGAFIRFLKRWVARKRLDSGSLRETSDLHSSPPYDSPSKILEEQS